MVFVHPGHPGLTLDLRPRETINVPVERLYRPTLFFETRRSSTPQAPDKPKGSMWSPLVYGALFRYETGH